MLTAMTEEDWTIVLRVFAASRSRRGDKGRNDRKFLEALHYFVVHNITWRALPPKVSPYTRPCGRIQPKYRVEGFPNHFFSDS